MHLAGGGVGSACPDGGCAPVSCPTARPTHLSTHTPETPPPTPATSPYPLGQPLSLADALCGTSLAVRTLDGRTLDVPIHSVITPGAFKVVK